MDYSHVHLLGFHGGDQALALTSESYVSATSLSFLGFCSRYYCTKSQVELQATCHGDRDKFVLSRGRYGISLGYILAGYP